MSQEDPTSICGESVHDGENFKFSNYAISKLPIVYNTVIGIEEVSRDVVEAARGMGMNNYMIYRKIKIPLASKVILGGIRTSTVINISAATLAAAVGAGGLGVPLVNGVRTFDIILILQGAIPVTLLAIITELSIKNIEHRFDV